mmetsp:Transcript_13922/g.22729  ORF Transcript_13922/g.22729 Transcript_13922/m.22729 type:complete len:533 (+) Transcript_13922:234-1832(+)
MPSGRAVMKAGGVAALLGALWKSYEAANSFSWEDATESALYQHWLSFCKSLVENGFVPQYLPVGVDGRPMAIPSTSPQVYAVPPRSVAKSRVLEPWQLGSLTLRNRVIRAAAFDGESEQEIIDTHVDLAKGGVGMTTLAYCSVSANGRTFDHQLVMEPSRVGFYKRLTSQVHEHGAAISCQLTHGGSFADRETIGEKQIAPSSVFNPAGFDFPREMTEQDLDKCAADFVAAAVMAKDVGFDCLEVHIGHGYLLSQFLSPKTNCRSDDWGGSIEGRVAFPVRCVKEIRAAIGPGMPIIVKLNMFDGMPGGLELEESTIAARILAPHVSMLVLTVGFVSANAFYMLRGNTPQEKLVQALPHTWKKLAMMTFGPLVVPSVEYEDCFLRDAARHILREVGNTVPICLLGGVNSFSQMEGAIEEGFEAVQMARLLIREPDFVNRIVATLRLQEETTPQNSSDSAQDVVSKCIRCNMCVIATVDPHMSIGCPFRRGPVLSAEMMREKILSEGGEDSVSRDIRDIEDLVVEVAHGQGRM